MTLAGLVIAYSREYRVTQREVASSIGMCERTFRRRLATPDAFTVGQVRTMKTLLHIPAEELRRII